MKITKTDYILRSLQKVSKKKWELFIISRIIHKLNDSDIEFVTQQLVRMSDEKQRFLTDMYFPQFGLHLEINERHHLNAEERDHRREQDIIQITGHQISHIDTAVDTMYDKGIDQICTETDVFVDLIRELKAGKVREGKFIPWDWGVRYSSAPVIERGYLDVEDNVTFRLQYEAMRCFGFSGKGWQRGTWKIPDGSNDWLWFPRLYEHGIWHNELTPDGKHIFGRAINDEGRTSNAKQMKKAQINPDANVIVFAKSKDSLGFNLLRYVGTFRQNHDASNVDAIQFDLIESREPVRVNY